METHASAFEFLAAKRRHVALVVSISLCLVIAGCGGSSTTNTPPTLSSLAITPASPTILLGGTQQLTATGTYSNGSTADLTASVTWSSSDSAVVTVSSSGLATSAAPGSVNISAASGSITTHTSLAVNAALVSIAVTPSGQSVPVNGTQQFTATGAFNDASHKDITGSVIWSSSDTSIATVSGAGLATGVAAGSASIRAASGSVTGSTSLTVTPILVSISVTAADSVIDINTTSQFTATGNLSDGSAQDLTQSVTWSAPGGIASVDNSGLATGLAIGTTTVYATSAAISGSAGLQVTAPTLLSILISPNSTSVPLGINQAFTATGVFSNGDSQDLASAVWNSSDPTKVSIDSSGSAQTPRLERTLTRARRT